MVEKHDEHLNTEAADEKKKERSASEDTKVRIERDSDEVALDEEESAAPDVAEEIPSEEEKLRARVAELEDKLLRTAADFENRKKRLDRQAEEAIRSSTDRLISQLLDVVDNFERALHHGDENKESFRQGIELIFSQLNDLLGRYDVRPIDAVGKPFDPSLHEAIMQIDSDEHDEGIVAMEINKGYRAGDRVLRYAKVGVSRGKPKAPEAGSNDESENGNLK